MKVLKEWECSFTSLLKHQEGLELFETFLKSEFSEENIQFWLACEKFKTVSDHLVVKEANTIYEEYIAPQAPKLVSKGAAIFSPFFPVLEDVVVLLFFPFKMPRRIKSTILLAKIPETYPTELVHMFTP